MSDTGVAIVVQARMTSSRLPGKVLLPLAGEPALVRMMERVARVSRADARLVATSEEPSDDAIADSCEERGIVVARGPLDDVLGRLARAVPPACSVVVRLTGDCPLVDPALVDRHIALFLADASRGPYVTNAVLRTQPDGLDVEVVSKESLLLANQHAESAFNREHVLPWIRRNAAMVPVTQKVDLSALRWTLDTRADYEVVAAIYDALYPTLPTFTSADVYRLLMSRPALIRIAGRERLDDEERTHWVRCIGDHLDMEAAS